MSSSWWSNPSPTSSVSLTTPLHSLLVLLSSMYNTQHVSLPQPHVLVCQSHSGYIWTAVLVEVTPAFPYDYLKERHIGVVVWNGFEFVLPLSTRPELKETVVKALEKANLTWGKFEGRIERVREEFLNRARRSLETLGSMDLADCFCGAEEVVGEIVDVEKGQKNGLDFNLDLEDPASDVEISEGADRRSRNFTATIEPSASDNYLTLSASSSSSSASSAKDSSDEGSDGDISESSKSMLSESRYHQDFKELKMLGSGGGGSVWKARNKLDRRLYAIKKVTLLPETLGGSEVNARLKEEVGMLAAMECRWICRYYQGWVEDGRVRKDSEGKVKEGIESEHLYINEDNDNSDGSNDNDGWWRSTEGTEWNDKWEDEDGELDAPFEEEYGSPKLEYGSPNLAFGSAAFGGVSPKGSPSRSHSSLNITPATLYIQMEYCPSTLKHLIGTSKLLSSPDRISALIRQILEGLAYIHAHGVIHRDLKPGNIFIDGEGEIRIGDFGLATQKSRSRKRANSAEGEYGKFEAAEGQKSDTTESTWNKTLLKDSSTLTEGVGTAFYRAPEQEQTRSSSYDEKADIFSFGVVVFEMLNEAAGTSMERASRLSRLRGEGNVTNWILRQKDNDDDQAGEIPILENDNDNGLTRMEGRWKEEAEKRFDEDFRNSCPVHFQKLIIWCISKNPVFRPTASQLLSSELLPREMELSSKYLEEAISLISTSQGSDSLKCLMESLFDQVNPRHTTVT